VQSFETTNQLRFVAPCCVCDWRSEYGKRRGALCYNRGVFSTSDRSLGQDRIPIVPSSPVRKQLRHNFGTVSVQLSERKTSILLPKRHQIKHLELLVFIVRDQGVGGSNPLSPTNLFKINYLQANDTFSALDFAGFR
jgi:hypothetical protein